MFVVFIAFIIDFIACHCSSVVSRPDPFTVRPRGYRGSSSYFSYVGVGPLPQWVWLATSMACKCLLLPLLVLAAELHLLLSSSESCVDDAGIKKRLRELLLEKELANQAGLSSGNPARSCLSIFQGVQADSLVTTGYRQAMVVLSSHTAVWSHLNTAEEKAAGCCLVP